MAAMGAIKEAIIIPILAASINVSCDSKANSVINMETVKPMPAKRLNPSKCIHFIDFGRAATLSLVSIQTVAIMPKGFPITRPKITPKTIG